MGKSTESELQDLNAKLDEMRTDCMTQTRDWLAMYTSGLNYVFGNQLGNIRVKDGWDKVSANYIFPAMMQELAITSQRQSTILALPWEGDDAAGAEVWQSHLQWLYEKELKIPTFLLRAAMDGKLGGYYVAATYWEPRKSWDAANRRWVGGPQVSLVPPAYFGMDPESETVDDAGYMYTCRRMNRELAKSKWPEFAAIIDQATDDPSEISDVLSATDLYQLNQENGTDSGNLDTAAQLVSLLNQARSYGGTTMAATGQKSRTVLVEQWFFKDFEEKRREDKEPIPPEELIEAGVAVKDGLVIRLAETGEPLGPLNWPQKITGRYMAPEYPRGRFVLRIGGQILNPRTEEQVWQFSRWPFVVGVNHILPHVWQGLNAVEMARGCQDWINISLMHLANYVKNFGDPKVLVEDGALAGVKAEDRRTIAKRLASRAGSIWHLAKGGLKRIRTEAPAPLSPGVVQFFQLMSSEVRSQTGVHEIAEGRSSGGKVTATEATRLETNTKLRTALANKMLDDFTVKLFENLTEISQRNYDPGELVRVTGQKNAKTVAAIEAGMIDQKYDISLQVGTGLPFDRERKKGDYAELLKILGPIPSVLEGLLQSYEVPNAEQVLSEVQEYQAFKQFQAMQQQAAMTAEGGVDAQPN